MTKTKYFMSLCLDARFSKLEEVKREMINQTWQKLFHLMEFLFQFFIFKETKETINFMSGFLMWLLCQSY
jgi:hypothetical protein